MPGVLIVARMLAWGIALGAVVAVAVGYETLPDTLPLSRWSSAPKSPLVALRVPLINLLTLGLIEVLSRGLRRVKSFTHAGAIVDALMLTAAAKAGIEAAGLLALPEPFEGTVWPLVVVLLLGLGTAAYLARELLQPRGWPQLQMTRWETVAAIALAGAVALLNLPLLIR